MDQIYPNEGLLDALRAQLAGSTGGGLTWDLFLANSGPNNIAVTLSQLTLASSMAAFPAIFVPGSAFTIASVANNIATLRAGIIQFRNVSGNFQTVLGYAIYDAAVRRLEGFAYFDDAISVPNHGYVPVLPVLGTYSGLVE